MGLDQHVEFNLLMELGAYPKDAVGGKAQLLKAINESYAHHASHCPAFSRFAGRRDPDLKGNFSKFEDIPYLPVQAFKEFWSQLVSVSPEDVKIKLQSSATSGVPSTVGVDKETSKRQIKALSSVLSEALGPQRRPFLIIDLDPSKAPLSMVGARGAAVRGFLNLARESHYCISLKDNKLHFDFDQFSKMLQSFEESKGPTVVLGFTFVLYAHAIKPALDAGVKFSLPKGTKIVHIGGWKKLEDQKVSKEQFNKDAATVFGLEPSDVVDFYGFTEQMGVTYPDDFEGVKVAPAFAEVLVRDPNSLEVLPDGQPGLLQFITPIPYSYPGISILTDDVGVIVSRNYVSPSRGWSGTGFKVLGRAKKAEVRGCGDIMGDKIQSSNVSQTKSTDENVYLLFSSEKNFVQGDLDAGVHLPSLPKVKDLNALMMELKANQSLLYKYSVDDLISLIGAAARRWVEPNSPLSPLMASGLSFLSSWCQPASMRRMVDNSLKGQRAVLDGFVGIDGFGGRRFMRAQSRGLVSHWLAGNVPLLGMLSLAQSILTKNANILKAASTFSNVMPLLLDSFRDLEVKTFDGRILKGNDILKTIAVIYYDRSNLSAAHSLSSEANVRLAWGGREAVESVMSLPRKYGTEDIVFGPKLSYMAIGKESLSEERLVKKLVKAAAIDSSVFDQYACASPHTIFIEKGGRFVSPEGFCELMAEQMDKIGLRIPKDPVDAGTLSNINRKRLQYEFNEKLWTSAGSAWTVLYDEKFELAEPCYSRVITVRGVNDILETAKLANHGIQTIGLSMSAGRKQKFADKASSLGAERFPDIGRMTFFDSPWDGIFPIERLTRWISMGGPF